MTKPSTAITWSLEAEADLIEIWLYGAREHAPAAADRHLREIYATGMRLGEWPYMGRDRSEVLAGLRSVSVPPHVIFYRLTNSIVEIVRVLHGRRDIEAIFTED